MSIFWPAGHFTLFVAKNNFENRKHTYLDIFNEKLRIFFLSTHFFENTTKDLILLKVLILYDSMYAIQMFQCHSANKKLNLEHLNCCSFTL